jgi:RNA polymerase sigma-70 factor (ECF subfamily)
MEPSPSLCAPDAWVDAHGDALFRYARSRLRDAVSAEDVVQETLLAALSAQRDFRGDAAERTWLIGILRHKLADHLRKRCRELPLSADEEGDAVVDGLFVANGHWKRAPGAWHADAGTLADQREFWAVFNSCREALPARQAAVFTLRLLEEREAEDVCQELGVSATNLCVLLHRARLRLRECLETKWFGKEATP